MVSPALGTVAFAVWVKSGVNVDGTFANNSSCSGVSSVICSELVVRIDGGVLVLILLVLIIVLILILLVVMMGIAKAVVEGRPICRIMNIIPIKANDAGTGRGRKYNLKPILWMAVEKMSLGAARSLFPVKRSDNCDAVKGLIYSGLILEGCSDIIIELVIYPIADS